ncbi:hypothetical protein [Dyadobacter sp. CY326]|uniref:hypothetical protein n=1 Tax=Dyadobacter sp. CY326 TaxID=2907300 RepID=UPI001F46E61C|nr:hypothetical protein [Dyadobacter sp. CY326]MCE7064986.1 hypothetical protein [Dyadobacter sp. CY326]
MCRAYRSFSYIHNERPEAWQITLLWVSTHSNQKERIYIESGSFSCMYNGRPEAWLISLLWVETHSKEISQDMH